MSAAELNKLSDDFTPEQRRQRVTVILARAVMRRVRFLRRSPPTEKHDSAGSVEQRDDLLLVNREILL